MSKIHYRSRCYAPGDELSINDLYFRITGRRRTSKQWSWQWQQAPGGPGDIWLIEAVHPDGRVELIGHHGIMPVRFTRGPEDLLFGKTENTMVLPEYRRKILYPRFEQRFALEYEPRYHALFSTMGPPEAIRQRKALGYTSIHSWTFAEHSTHAWRAIARVLARLPRGYSELIGKALITGSGLKNQLPRGTGVLAAREARGSAFLQDYWKFARGNWGVSPRRDPADLAWRYWDNPYIDYYAVTVQDPDLGCGVGIVMRGSLPGQWSLSDVSIQRPCPRLLEHVLSSVVRGLAARFGCRALTFSFTDDSVAGAFIETVERVLCSSKARRPMHKDGSGTARYMPRKVTSKGTSVNLKLDEWDITGMLFEGRS